MRTLLDLLSSWAADRPDDVVARELREWAAELFAEQVGQVAPGVTRSP